jgi:hypothetical protein
LHGYARWRKRDSLCASSLEQDECLRATGCEARNDRPAYSSSALKMLRDLHKAIWRKRRKAPLAESWNARARIFPVPLHQIEFEVQ